MIAMWPHRSYPNMGQHISGKDDTCTEQYSPVSVDGAAFPLPEVDDLTCLSPLWGAVLAAAGVAAASLSSAEGVAGTASFFAAMLGSCNSRWLTHSS